MAYPNTTSQSLHTLKINKVPDKGTFEKMQEDNLVNANELYLVEGDDTATLNVESPITYANNIIGFDGYNVTTTTTTLCNETVTTSDRHGDGYYSSELAYSVPLDTHSIKVTFDGIEYICSRKEGTDGWTFFYGANYTSDFLEYPFCLEVNYAFGNTIYTETASTHTIKIESIIDDIIVSSDFAKARGYSTIITNNTILCNESVTTAVDTNMPSRYIGNLVYRSSIIPDTLKITFDGIEYICSNIQGSSYGAFFDWSTNEYDFSEYPFRLETQFSDENWVIITETASTHTIKIETLPKVAITTEDFQLAVHSSFSGNVMIQGVDYVTAGQKLGEFLGSNATAEGIDTISSGTGSHAEGYSTIASNQGSHAEGNQTTASNYSSHAEGSGTTASGNQSHAEGANTTASGYYSHAEGSGTTASGSTSHAEGYKTTASGIYSHAEGCQTTANHKSQHVFGEYNVLDTSTNTAANRGNYVEIVGKGTSNSARSNARTLDWNGNEVLAGKLTVGAGPTANMDVATKQYVDNATSGAGTVTSVRVQATSPVVSSVSTAQSTSLNTTISLANGYGDTKNPYASKTKNYVLAAPSNTNGVPSFRALVADDIPSLTVSKISDFPTIHTYTAGNDIDITNDTIGFDGYDVTTTTTTLCNETVTTTNPDEESYASVYLTYSAFIVSNPIKVTFNGIEYICSQSDSGGYSCYGGATSFNSVDFSEYPFGLVSSGFTNVLYTKNTGTYTVKIETITDNITVSSDFAKARGYSIIGNPSQVLVNESTTTTNSESTYNEGTLSYFSESNDVIKVTFDNVEYICPNNNYVYGASWDTVSGGYDFSTYPFNLDPVSYGDDNYTRIITQTAGTHTVKIENFPTVAVLTDDFKQAIKSSFPGNVMIQGVDYVTAGQASGSSRGASATAEGWSTTASGESSHAEGSFTTASGNQSHAEGANTTASGYYSHAEGSNTTASEFWSHAEGGYTTASGVSSHAEGNRTTASGRASHAEGVYTTANHKSQHVFGEYNILDTSTATADNRGNYVEIVGKGTSTSARSNARTLDWNGNEVLAGKLTVGTAPTANMDVATKKYVDDATSSHTHGYITNDGDITTQSATIESGDRLVINDESASKITNSFITFGTSTTQYLANNGTWQSVPTKISDLTNDSGFTVDDKTWNGVQLAKQSATNSGDSTYVPLATSTSPVNMSFTPVKKTPTNNAIAKYDSSAYLYSTTPSASDNSTKVATTAYVDNAIPTKTSDLTNDSGFITTDEKVKQTAKSDNVNYKLLFTNSASPTSGNSAEAAYDTDITINPSTNTITATNFAGNATSATVATKLGTTTSNTTSAGSVSVPVYFHEGVPIPVSLTDLRDDMGITNPLTFWGITTTELETGDTYTSLAGLSGTPQNGYVVIDGNYAQFVWGTVNGVAQWNQLGTGVAYKIIQDAVPAPTANGSTTAFIDTISQNANGVISVTKKNLDTSGTWSGNATTATTASKLGSSNLGSATKPIYLASGTATEGSTYAGGTAITLNNSSKAASTASFYAPTSSGTSGQVLKSNGNGQAPTWITLTIPTKTSDLTNDSGFITTETDPTVPSWAKASSKPAYTKSEVGLGNVDNVQQYSASNPPPYPVTSVNGNTGAITGLQTTSNLVTSVSSSSTNSQYPSAKLFYDTVGNIESLLASI